MNVEALLNFSSQEESGAVLLTKGHVTRESVNFRQPYKQWCRANSARILGEWPDVRERGS